MAESPEPIVEDAAPTALTPFETVRPRAWPWLRPGSGS